MERSEMLKAEAELWSQMFSFVKSMSIKCAIELGIPDAMHNHGQPMTLSELHAALSLPVNNKPNLRRLLRMLTHLGFLKIMNRSVNEEVVYGLTDMSRLVVDKANPSSLSSFVLAMLDFALLKPTLHLGDMLKQDKLDTFEIAHGCKFWELTAKFPEFNTLFNKSMASDSSFISEFIIKNGNIFQGVSSLVDVGGGPGIISIAIAKAFPNIKCTVLDLPQVVDQVPNDGVVKFVTGDMFKHIPPADVAFIMWTLSDWCDEDSIEILKRCREAIPSKDAGGKVIIVDTVLGSPGTKHRETHLLIDMVMLSTIKGRERDENDWWNLFKAAGFSSYKITPTLGVRSIIEVYP